MQDRPSLEERLEALRPPPPPREQEAPPEPVRKPRWWGAARVSRRTPDRPCLNCGDATVGNYCPVCGQRKIDVRISLRRMLREAMDDQFSLNSTLPRTLGTLLFRPGRLTSDYVQGRMSRYIPPFRLYLVCSLLFFVALSFVADPGELSMNEEGDARRDSVRTARIADSVMLAHARRTGEDTVPLARAVAKAREVPPPDMINFGTDPEEVPGLLKPLVRRIEAAETRLNAMSQREALRTLIAAFEENAPIGVFLMMPLFAAILKLLYLRRKRFYVEHFVFALHTHAFAFLTGTVVLLLDNDAVEAVVLVWLLIYLFLALKRVYGQGIIRTFIHYVGLGIAYSFLMIVGVLATVLMTALSI
jgi:hypothetical protein